MPGSVTMMRGRRGSVSILCRSWLMKTLRTSTSPSYPAPQHAVEEPAVGEQLSGVLGQGLDEGPFGLRQPDLLAVAGDPVARQVDGQVSRAELQGARRALAARPAEERPDPRHELVGAEGLGQI